MRLGEGWHPPHIRYVLVHELISSLNFDVTSLPHHEGRVEVVAVVKMVGWTWQTLVLAGEPHW